MLKRRQRTPVDPWVAVMVLTIALCFHAEAGDIVVSTVGELYGAVETATPGTNILLSDGTYQLSSYPLYVVEDSITVRSISGDPDTVVIRGEGMVGGVMQVFLVGGHHFTARDMTVGWVANHAVQLLPDTDFVHLENLKIFDTGEQMVKVPYDPLDMNKVSEAGIVEGCRFEYTAGIGPQYYIGGIDVHNGSGWIVRDNVFTAIRSPSATVAEHAIHFWTQSENTLVERNVIINCDRGIGFGLGDRGHIGGIIRNNMIYHEDSADFGDVSIGLESAPGAQVYNNTIYAEHSYPAAIEYRYAATTEVLIANNLTNKIIMQRDGASGTVTHNITDAVGGWFVDPASGDLHLATGIAAVVDQGLTIPECAEDFDGDLRPEGDAYDIGADEFVVPPMPWQILFDLAGHWYESGYGGMGDVQKDGTVDELDVLDLALEWGKN